MVTDAEAPFSPRRDILSRTFGFGVLIIKLCVRLDRQPGVSRTLSAQLLRSGTSIGANMEEAQAADLLEISHR